MATTQEIIDCHVSSIATMPNGTGHKSFLIAMLIKGFPETSCIILPKYTLDMKLVERRDDRLFAVKKD